MRQKWKAWKYEFVLAVLALSAPALCAAQEPVQVSPRERAKIMARQQAEAREQGRTAGGEDDPLGGKFSLEEAEKGLTGEGTLTAVLDTSLGTINCELFEKDAPLTVANFVGLARGLRPFRLAKSGKWVKRPYYNGLLFHRVVPGFLIQSGDQKGDGKSGPGYRIADEKNGPHRFDRAGVLAMATPAPQTESGQFLIADGAARRLEDTPLVPSHYQIFGQCQETETIKKIASVPRNDAERPLQPVRLRKVTIKRVAPAAEGRVPADQAAPAKKTP